MNLRDESHFVYVGKCFKIISLENTKVPKQAVQTCFLKYGCIFISGHKFIIKHMVLVRFLSSGVRLKPEVI